MSKAKHAAPYDRADMKLMRQCARLRMSARLAARALGRSVGGVKWKAMSEGIHFRAINQRPGTQRTPQQRRRLSEIQHARWRRVRMRQRRARR
jgi:hypothetical protein